MAEKKIIINVGRQLGSGGRAIGKLLAEEFGCSFYDKEILNLAAKESGFSESFFEQHDEHKRFFKSLFHLHTQHLSDNNFYTNNFSEESLFQFQAEAILKAAKTGNCVFVGRCADYILRDYPDAINIFITGDIKERATQVMHRHGCDYEAALKIINTKEGNRASYYNYFTGKKWGQCESYDLSVNSSLLGIEGCAKLIAQYVRQRLQLPEAK